MPVLRLSCSSGNGGQQQGHTSAWTAIELAQHPVKGHRPWLYGGRRCNLCDTFFFHVLIFDSNFSSL